MHGDAAGEPLLLRFGRFELDLVQQQLRREGLRVRLQPQPFKLLSLLARRAGEVVSREELRREVWGDGTFVDFEQGLGFCVRQIRGALGDAARSPIYIETLPRRGYRFVAPVESVHAAPGASASLRTLLRAALRLLLAGR